MYSSPISFVDVKKAAKHLDRYLKRTPVKNYPLLDKHVGYGISVFIKHENYQPTNSFKVRNALSAMSYLLAQGPLKGVVAASRGNHGMGLAWAGQKLGVPVTICVAKGNNPEKNKAIKAYGARLIEGEINYDSAIAMANRLVEKEGLTLIHSTNNKAVLAGAATITWEMIQEVPDLDVIFYGIGGGSLAVGGIVLRQALKKKFKVIGLQASQAPASYLSWKKKEWVTQISRPTLADGLALNSPYEMTFPTLMKGLDDFFLLSEKEIANSIRVFLEQTHNLVEGAGAVGLAGLLKMRKQLKGKKIGLILTGSNIDTSRLYEILK